MTLTYKELQAKLKDLRANGYDVQVKLNSKLEVLQVEFDRLTRELEQATATATDTEVVTTVVEDEPQYCNFFPYEPVREVTEFDKTGNTKQYEFAGATVYFIDGVDYFGWELDQWLTRHEGIACKRPANDELSLTQHKGMACEVTLIIAARDEQLKMAVTRDVMFETTLKVREFGELETYTAVESQPLTVEFLANETKGVTVSDEPLPLYERQLDVCCSSRVADTSRLTVLLLTFMLLAVVWLGRTVAERLSTFARETDETAWQAWQNLVWMLRCCWFFSLGFFKL